MVELLPEQYNAKIKLRALVLPPGKKGCCWGTWLIYAARSRHPSGVNVAMSDESGRFIKNSISARVWRALSTTKGSEIVAASDY